MQKREKQYIRGVQQFKKIIILCVCYVCLYVCVVNVSVFVWSNYVLCERTSMMITSLGISASGVISFHFLRKTNLILYYLV